MYISLHGFIDININVVQLL